MPFLAAVIITLLIASILGTAAAYIAQTVSQKTTSVTLVEMIFVFEAIFAAGASWLMLGEELGVFAILGCTLILIGMMIVELAEPFLDRIKQKLKIVILEH